MNLIKRFLNIVKSLYNLADKAEDPAKTLVLVSEKLRMDIVKAKQQAVESIAREKVLLKELTRQKEVIINWEVRAEDAVKSERDDLAKEALMRKANSIKRYGDLNHQYNSLSASNTELKKDLRQMENKYSELQDKTSDLQAK